jgi:HEAT repeat protein
VTDDPQAKAATQRRIDAAMVKKATIADLENELGATPSGSGRARGALMGRLGADFRLHPEDAEKAVAYARSAPVADGQAMAGALGGAGTAESMKALAEIANSSDAPKAVRVNAIGALALEQTPSSANVQALKTMSGDSDPEIASAATLALGAAARTVAGTDPVAYDDAVGALLADLANAQSAQEMILDLRALGNSGDPRVLGAAEQAMSVQDEGVRIAAVAAVRFVAGSACDDFLANAAQTDPDAAVRIQAIGTIQAYRSDVEYLPTFTSVMRNDPSPLVRRAVLQALNLIKTNPAATSLIAATARDDASEDVRQFAHAILDS